MTCITVHECGMKRRSSIMHIRQVFISDQIFHCTRLQLSFMLILCFGISEFISLHTVHRRGRSSHLRAQVKRTTIPAETEASLMKQSDFIFALVKMFSLFHFLPVAT